MIQDHFVSSVEGGEYSEVVRELNSIKSPTARKIWFRLVSRVDTGFGEGRGGALVDVVEFMDR